ncbi:redox-regulated ATPase YchF [Desulfovirgula thermocuniculi]|uniref:redox-regulated ATPase YchF n=1 Tax=Desulfovirgula thermocuniculi TaxID=348842 RepID=UPI00146F98DE|nr:redox-regulated ATPase YchF [Desulfovirgula thermocuniculi]
MRALLTLGIIGLPMVGKTTVFNLLTRGNARTSRFMSSRAEVNVGAAQVKDRRVAFLSALYRPRKTTYAQVQCSDVPGLVRGSSEGMGLGNQFLEAIRNADLLVHVLRAFRNPAVLHVEGDVDPYRDFETVRLELLLADLELVERRMERIRSGKKMSKEAAFELEVLAKCLQALENEIPLHQAGLTEEERLALRNYSFFTEKPMILVVNTDEEQFKSRRYPGQEKVERIALEKGLKVFTICAQLEMEIAQLPPEERQAFLSDLGVEELGSERLVRAAYEQLGLISFFTASEEEVRAWTVRRGTTAKKAAGKVHSDMERGFIRAEVISFDDLFRAGSMARARESGLVRLEGKDYVVQDGDVIYFRFNV